MGRLWVVVILTFLAVASAGATQVQDVRLWRAPDHTRVVFDLSAPAEHKLITLANPRRIVLDLKDTYLADEDFARAGGGRSTVQDALETLGASTKMGPKDYSSSRIVI